jgi:hypothetical protein
VRRTLEPATDRVPGVVSSAPAYGPATQRRARDPIVAEWMVRGVLALAFFAGFYALGHTTAPAGGSEAAPPTPLSSSTPAVAVPDGLSADRPLEAAFGERAAREHAELERAAAAARAKRAQRARTVPTPTQGTQLATGAQPPANAPAVPSHASAPTQSPPPRRSSPRRSSGTGTPFDSSG